MNDLSQFLSIWLPATQRGTYRCFAWWSGGFGVRNILTFQRVTDRSDEDALKIRDLVDKRGEVFVYLSTFSQRSTKAEYAESVPFLWLDLDNLQERLDPEPTLIWSTSEGHYQALWQLDWVPSVGEREALNKGLFEHFKGLGADASWDVSRRLRLPGTVNQKPGRGNWPVTIAEASGLVYGQAELPAPVEPVRIDSSPPSLGAPPSNLVSMLPLEIQELWSSVPPVGERSDVLMRLLLALAKQPLTDEEIFQIAAGSGSNKFIDRPQRLWLEVQKARRLAERPPPGLRITLPDAPVTRAGPSEQGAAPPHPLAGWLSRSDLPEDFEIKWTVNPFLPRKSVLLAAGLPGTRKSWLVSNLAVSVMHGAEFMGHPCQAAGPVAYVAPDDERERLSERIHLIERRLEVDPAKSNFYWRQTGFSFLDPRWATKLEEFIKAVAPRLIIMDGLYLLGYNAQDYGASLAVNDFETPIIRTLQCPPCVPPPSPASQEKKS